MNNLIFWFRKVALWEGLSYILLVFIAMPLKYFWDSPEFVKHLGRAHGGLFVAYIILLIMCKSAHGWSIERVIKYFIASLIPFATFWVEKDAVKPEANR